MDFPLLTLLIVLPAIFAALIAAVPGDRRDVIRGMALAGTVITFVASLLLLGWFSVGEPGFQLEETAQWIPQWGVTYRLGVDGVSLFLVLLTTLIMPLAILAAWDQVEGVKGFFGSLLALQAAMVGVFVALDLILFYVFFEIMLVPMYALIGIWGGKNRRYAALKFFLYTLIGGLLMLVAILYLYFAAGAQSFDYDVIRQVELTTVEQTWLFLAFFAAFGIKVPVFPVHTWLPDAHTEAPTVGSVILAAVLLKIGGYGFLRFSLPYFPEATTTLAPPILVLGVIAVIYGALVAMVQADIKKLVAYSSVAHLGFVVLGIFALDVTGAAGSVVQMINHGLTTGALFLLVGFMYERTHSRMIADYSGLMSATPVFGGLFLVTAMSSVALPGLNGFVGEFPILLGTFQSVPWAAVLAAFGVIFAALYLLWAYQRMFHGPVEGLAAKMTDLKPREIGIMVPLILLMVGIGLYPQPMYDRVTPSVEAIVVDVQEATAADAHEPAVADEVDGADEEADQ
ncbi:NADH-quinone oxidoreductase subunit M [Egibacter rhizosphaerae]|uniref:NADH-quinone oxidoreductase subunit M n=1 Tax=Egibacter rhizosphaerae TaxID=1670831 RepID=A0A411YGT8_9ACTN|nr:NADH-quinone oxidoreductase subunit M [Egibacter rhizosphaerae]QBI20369.1 NADH-quinone oxidoreductase subunit M [Egibacter rhizosphaerae]